MQSTVNSYILWLWNMLMYAFPSLLMPWHLASLYDSLNSSFMPPGNHENLQSCPFPPLHRWEALHLSVVHGEKSTSTVKAIHSSVLPYLLDLLVISSVYNRVMMPWIVTHFPTTTFVFHVQFPLSEMPFSIWPILSHSSDSS